MSLGEIFEEKVRKFKQKVAIIQPRKKITYQELNRRINRLANGLRNLKIADGDKVAIILPNSLEFVTSFFALLKLGAVVIPGNPRWRKGEIKHLLLDSGAKGAIIPPDLEPILNELKKDVPSLKTLMVAGGLPVPRFLRASAREAGRQTGKSEEVTKSLDNLMKNKSSRFKTKSISSDDLAVLLYTSGTTGKPKGAMLTHKNLISNAQAVTKNLKLKADDCMLCIIPLFHAFALTVGMLAPLFAGIKIVLMDKFIPQKVLENIAKHQVSILPGVPTIFAFLANQPGVKPSYLKSLRYCISGGAPLAAELANKFAERYGRRILEGYGLSEASPVVSFHPTTGKYKPGSIGKPIPGVKMKIVDEENNEVPAGVVGEILVKGPNVMKGYYNNESATAEVLKSGWLYTGDLGKCDEEGYYYIVGRKKDLIIVGGFNVYPREVEEVIYLHPKVKEVAVVGVTDKLRGEAVKAVIVPQEESGLSWEEVMDFCQKNLAPYKVPRYIEFREVLPKSDTGKILKDMLK